MKRISLLLIIVVVFFLGLIFEQTKAVSQEKKFLTVYPFSMQGVEPLIGFFDQQDGKIYIYKPDLSQSLFEYQLDEVGKPAKRLK